MIISVLMVTEGILRQNVWYLQFFTFQSRKFKGNFIFRAEPQRMCKLPTENESLEMHMDTGTFHILKCGTFPIEISPARPQVFLHSVAKVKS